MDAIINERELAERTEQLFKLTALDAPSAQQLEEIDRLTQVIQTYEERYCVESIEEKGRLNLAIAAEIMSGRLGNSGPGWITCPIDKSAKK